MASRARATFAVFLAAIAGLAIGYFAGREHLKYEMRSAITTAVADFQRSIGGVSSSPPATPLPQLAVPKPPQSAMVTLANKGFKASNPTAGDFENDIPSRT